MMVRLVDGGAVATAIEQAHAGKRNNNTSRRHRGKLEPARESEKKTTTTTTRRRRKTPPLGRRPRRRNEETAGERDKGRHRRPQRGGVHNEKETKKRAAWAGTSTKRRENDSKAKSETTKRSSVCDTNKYRPRRITSAKTYVNKAEENDSRSKKLKRRRRDTMVL